MGGKSFRRGRGARIPEDMEEMEDEEECERDDGETTMSAGSLAEAAVEGLMSWVGDGWRLMETDWMAEASSAAGLDDMAKMGEDAGRNEERWDLLLRGRVSLLWHELRWMGCVITVVERPRYEERLSRRSRY